MSQLIPPRSYATIPQIAEAIAPIAKATKNERELYNQPVWFRLHSFGRRVWVFRVRGLGPLRVEALGVVARPSSLYPPDNLNPKHPAELATEFGHSTFIKKVHIVHGNKDQSMPYVSNYPIKF